MNVWRTPKIKASVPANRALNSPDTPPSNAPKIPIRARNGAHALAHNLGIHSIPPIIPEGDLSNVKRTKNSEKQLRNIDENLIRVIACIFFLNELAYHGNELSIVAAEGREAAGRSLRAAASIQIELSRTMKSTCLKSGI